MEFYFRLLNSKSWLYYRIKTFLVYVLIMGGGLKNKNLKILRMKIGEFIIETEKNETAYEFEKKNSGILAGRGINAAEFFSA